MNAKHFLFSNQKKRKNRKPKNLSLEESMNNKMMEIFKDNEFICIKDKYPKALFHALIIPISDDHRLLLSVAQILALNNCLTFLRRIQKFSLKVIDLLPNSINKYNLQLGFHAIQTFKPLHMHIISKDFSTNNLNKKQIWNSFNTSYFIALDDLINHFEKDLNYGQRDYFSTDIFQIKNIKYLESLLLSNIACNVCKKEQVNLVILKEHLLTHQTI